MQLYPDQIDVVERTRAAYQRGRRAPVIVAPTGFGKAVLASYMMAGAVAKGGRPLFIADRCTLLDQLVAKLAMAGITNPRVIQADRDDGPRDAPVTVASAPTLRMASWIDRLPEASLLIWDECFSAGTLVDGRPIETLRVGDAVRSYNHHTRRIELRPVRRLFASRPTTLVTVHLDDGRAITCTAGHPFFNGAKYISALHLQPGDRLYGEVGIGHAVCSVRSNGNSHRQEATRHSAQVRPYVLLDELPGRQDVSGEINPHGKHQSRARKQAYAGTKSNATRWRPCEDDANATPNRTSATCARRQRHRPISDGAAFARGPSCGLDIEPSRSDTPVTCQRIPGALQDRLSPPVEQDGHRSGWHEPWIIEQTRTGREKAGISRVARVVRVEVHERRGEDGFGALCRDDLVYNIEVDGNHNYFVDGILVHNCHHTSANTYRALIQRFPRALRLGLTATPTRGDNRPLDMFDELVIGPSVAQLIALGRLAPCQVIAPKPLRPGELARSPIDAWRLFAGGRRAAIFRTRVSEAEADRDDFRAAGLRAEAVTATTRDRADILARFAAGNLDAVASVGVLKEGWDDQGCSVAIVACQPGHVGTWLQICGRVLRYQPGKQALVVDLGGKAREHGHPAEEREYSLDGRGIQPLPRDAIRQCQSCGSVAPGRPTRCPYCGEEWPAYPFRRTRVVGAEMGEVEVGTRSRRPWVQPWTAKWPGRCKRCGQAFPAGTAIFFDAGVKGSERHQRCPGTATQPGATP